MPSLSTEDIHVPVQELYKSLHSQIALLCETPCHPRGNPESHEIRDGSARSVQNWIRTDRCPRHVQGYFTERRSRDYTHSPMPIRTPEAWAYADQIDTAYNPCLSQRTTLDSGVNGLWHGSMPSRYNQSSPCPLQRARCPSQFACCVARRPMTPTEIFDSGHLSQGC